MYPNSLARRHGEHLKTLIAEPLLELFFPVL